MKQKLFQTTRFPLPRHWTTNLDKKAFETTAVRRGREQPSGRARLKHLQEKGLFACEHVFHTLSKLCRQLRVLCGYQHCPKLRTRVVQKYRTVQHLEC